MKSNSSKLSLLIGGVILLIGMSGCKEKQTTKTEEVENQWVKTESGLQYKILKEGTGVTAENGDEVLLYETTSYRDGTQLYSNENSENPIKIKIGANQVTEGVDEGLKGMKAGEIKQLIVPSYLAKREFYPDYLSPDSTLVIKLIVDQVIKNE